MHAREAHPGPLHESDDGPKSALTPSQTTQVLSSARPHELLRYSTEAQSKSETPKARPCGVIAPERPHRQPSPHNFQLAQREHWLTPEIGFNYAAPPNPPTEYVYPQRNISPRQTFQENMKRILVPPRCDLTRIIPDANQPVAGYTYQSKNIKSNFNSETKHFNVPYLASQIQKPQRTSVVRNNEVYGQTAVPSAPGLQRAWPQTVPHTAPPAHPPPPYLYQHDYYSAQQQNYPHSAIRTAKLPHKKNPEEIQPVYGEDYYRNSENRFEPYPALKDKQSRLRYTEYLNYPNSFHSQKIDTSPHPYVNYTPQKYVDPRIVEPRIADSLSETYVRPGQYLPNFGNGNPDYLSGKCVQPPPNYNLPNKFYSYPDSSVKPSQPLMKGPFQFGKPFYDNNGCSKPSSLSENAYMSENSPYGPRRQFPLNNYFMNNNAQPKVVNYLYQHQNDISLKTFPENFPPYKYTTAHNPLAHIPTQFSPNIISPAESNTSFESYHVQSTPQDDCGYVSQCSSASNKSFDYSLYKVHQHENSLNSHRNYNVKSLNITNKIDRNSAGNKEAKSIDVRHFIQNWDENDDDECVKTNENAVTVVSNETSSIGNPEMSSVEQPLYVLSYVNIPNEEIDKYEHIQKICKLPENIRGYDSADLLNKFDEAFRPSEKPPEVPSRPLFEIPTTSNAGVARSPSPFDIEAKITQSVIHKDVGCNFEIKPFSPPPPSTSMVKIVDERKIEKIQNNVNQPIITEGQKSSKLALKRRNFSENAAVINNKLMKIVDTVCDAEKKDDHDRNYTSASGVCLASLPRLDNDIELNFPEINQQYSDLKQNQESVIINMSSSSLTDLENREIGHNSSTSHQMYKNDNESIQQISNDLDGFNKFCKMHDCSMSDAPQEENIQRTDSVIIKNPDSSEYTTPDLDGHEKNTFSVNDLSLATKCSEVKIDYCTENKHKSLDKTPKNDEDEYQLFNLSNSKSPINLIMHSHAEDYTNCIRPSLIHSIEEQMLSPKGKYNICQESQNCTSDEYFTCKINGNVAINLSLNADYSNESESLSEADHNTNLSSLHTEKQLLSSSSSNDQTSKEEESFKNNLNHSPNCGILSKSSENIFGEEFLNSKVMDLRVDEIVNIYKSEGFSCHSEILECDNTTDNNIEYEQEKGKEFAKNSNGKICIVSSCSDENDEILKLKNEPTKEIVVQETDTSPDNRLEENIENIAMHIKSTERSVNHATYLNEHFQNATNWEQNGLMQTKCCQSKQKQHGFEKETENSKHAHEHLTERSMEIMENMCIKVLKETPTLVNNLEVFNDDQQIYNRNDKLFLKNNDTECTKEALPDLPSNNTIHLNRNNYIDFNSQSPQCVIDYHKKENDNLSSNKKIIVNENSCVVDLAIDDSSKFINIKNDKLSVSISDTDILRDSASNETSNIEIVPSLEKNNPNLIESDKNVSLNSNSNEFACQSIAGTLRNSDGEMIQSLEASETTNKEIVPLLKKVPPKLDKNIADIYSNSNESASQSILRTSNNSDMEMLQDIAENENSNKELVPSLKKLCQSLIKSDKNYANILSDQSESVYQFISRTRSNSDSEMLQHLATNETSNEEIVPSLQKIDPNYVESDKNVADVYINPNESASQSISETLSNSDRELLQNREAKETSIVEIVPLFENVHPSLLESDVNVADICSNANESTSRSISGTLSNSDKEMLQDFAENEKPNKDIDTLSGKVYQSLIESDKTVADIYINSDESASQTISGKSSNYDIEIVRDLAENEKSNKEIVPSLKKIHPSNGKEPIKYICDVNIKNIELSEMKLQELCDPVQNKNIIGDKFDKDNQAYCYHTEQIIKIKLNCEDSDEVGKTVKTSDINYDTNGYDKIEKTNSFKKFSCLNTDSFECCHSSKTSYDAVESISKSSTVDLILEANSSNLSSQSENSKIDDNLLSNYNLNQESLNCSSTPTNVEILSKVYDQTDGNNQTEHCNSHIEKSCTNLNPSKKQLSEKNSGNCLLDSLAPCLDSNIKRNSTICELQLKTKMYTSLKVKETKKNYNKTKINKQKKELGTGLSKQLNKQFKRKYKYSKKKSNKEKDKECVGFQKMHENIPYFANISNSTEVNEDRLEPKSCELRGTSTHSSSMDEMKNLNITPVVLEICDHNKTTHIDMLKNENPPYIDVNSENNINESSEKCKDVRIESLSPVMPCSDIIKSNECNLETLNSSLTVSSTEISYYNPGNTEKESKNSKQIQNSDLESESISSKVEHTESNADLSVQDSYSQSELKNIDMKDANSNSECASIIDFKLKGSKDEKRCVKKFKKSKSISKDVKGGTCSSKKKLSKLKNICKKITTKLENNLIESKKSQNVNNNNSKILELVVLSQISNSSNIGVGVKFIHSPKKFSEHEDEVNNTSKQLEFQLETKEITSSNICSLQDTINRDFDHANNKDSFASKENLNCNSSIETDAFKDTLIANENNDCLIEAKNLILKENFCRLKDLYQNKLLESSTLPLNIPVKCADKKDTMKDTIFDSDFINTQMSLINKMNRRNKMSKPSSINISSNNSEKNNFDMSDNIDLTSELSFVFKNLKKPKYLSDNIYKECKILDTHKTQDYSNAKEDFISLTTSVNSLCKDTEITNKDCLFTTNNIGKLFLDDNQSKICYQPKNVLDNKIERNIDSDTYVSQWSNLDSNHSRIIFNEINLNKNENKDIILTNKNEVYETDKKCCKMFSGTESVTDIFANETEKNEIKSIGKIIDTPQTCLYIKNNKPILYDEYWSEKEIAIEPLKPNKNANKECTKVKLFEDDSTDSKLQKKLEINLYDDNMNDTEDNFSENNHENCKHNKILSICDEKNPDTCEKQLVKTSNESSYDLNVESHEEIKSVKKLEKSPEHVNLQNNELFSRDNNISVACGNHYKLCESTSDCNSDSPENGQNFERLEISTNNSDFQNTVHMEPDSTQDFHVGEIDDSNDTDNKICLSEECDSSQNSKNEKTCNLSHTICSKNSTVVCNSAHEHLEVLEIENENECLSTNSEVLKYDISDTNSDDSYKKLKYLSNNIFEDTGCNLISITVNPPSPTYPNKEKSNSLSTENNLENEENISYREIWIDDVACVETVISEDLEQSNDSFEQVFLHNNDYKEISEENQNKGNCDSSFINKKEICGDDMQKKDIHFVETLSKPSYLNIHNNLPSKEHFVRNTHKEDVEDNESHNLLSSLETSHSQKPLVLRLCNNSSKKVSGGKNEINECKSLKKEKLITKAAQKYVPPLVASAHDFTVKLTLPQEMLASLRKNKTKQQIRTPIPKLKISTSNLTKSDRRPDTNKLKLNFEDALKKIDDSQYISKLKHKKKINTVPKVIIKKTLNGSHYTSKTVNKDFNPDLTGSRWQPCVSLEKMELIDKMVEKQKTIASYCPITRRFYYQRKLTPKSKTKPKKRTLDGS